MNKYERVIFKVVIALAVILFYQVFVGCVRNEVIRNIRIYGCDDTGFVVEYKGTLHDYDKNR